MPNPEWGVKRMCPTCGTRFYDLTNDPTTCPNCAGVFSLDSLTLKRARPDRGDAKLAAAAAAAARVRDAGLEAAGRPGLVTYSRKVFVPLTRLCRDRCHY
ncbi:MAG TPA: TIGR02300 family protein, partial [Paracoccaceae bacterium]|nr:TIGR02300 family protein [Paracoccaceae bacterium]